MDDLIPLQRPEIGAEELEGVRRVFLSRWLGMGAEARAFEEALRGILHARHVVATNTGTSALHLALASLELPRGAEVVMPALTFVATPQAVVAAGLVPVFADIDPATLNVSPDSIARCLSGATRAVIPVHYRGAPCDMDAILGVAEDRGLVVVEDAAHAIGSRHRGRPVGGFGHVACFSFDPIKNITCGEGGAIAFNDPRFDAAHERALRMRVLGLDNDSWARNRERQVAYEVRGEGFRYHMADINAAIGLVQLQRRDAFAVRRRAIAARYDAAFAALPGVRVISTPYDEVVPFMYVVEVGDRTGFMAHLASRGVSCNVHYIPNHLHERFARCRRDDLRHTEAAAARIVTLPLFTEQTDAQVERVIDAVASAPQARMRS